MIFGYARVSTQEQNLDRQIKDLHFENCEKIYIEKQSGKNMERPELLKILDQIRPGDLIVVTELSRISRSTKDLFKIIDLLEEKKCNLKSLKESWIDTTTPQGKLMFTFFAGINQFERELISSRTKDGLAVAKSFGRIGGKRPTKKRIDNEEIIISLYKDNKKISYICEITNLSRSTIYRVVSEYKKKEVLK